MKLAEIGVLPAEAVLRHLEFPNVEELSRKARDERLEQHQMDLEVAGRNQGGQQQEQPQRGVTASGVDMIALADKENMQMMNGENLPPTEGATPEHTQTHVDFVSSETFQNGTQGLEGEITARTFAEHIQGETEMSGQALQGQQMPGQQVQGMPQ